MASSIMERTRSEAVHNCPACGTENTAHRLFCMKCGSPLPASAPSAPCDRGPQVATGAEITPMQFQPSSRLTMSYNQLHMVKYRGGWIGLFAGENQTKALERAIRQLNSSGLQVVAAVNDRWSFWKRLGVALLLIATLGIVGRVSNVAQITEPTR